MIHTMILSGQWSGDIPVCLVMEGCEDGDLVDIQNGWRTAYRSYQDLISNMNCSHPRTDGLGTEGACGVITVTGGGQGLGPSWSGVSRATGDMESREKFLAASVSVLFRIMTLLSTATVTLRGWM